MKAQRPAREPILVPFDEEAPPQLSGRRIGELLLDAGKLTQRDIGRVLRISRDKHLRFGEAAVDLDLVEEIDVERALTDQLEAQRLPGLRFRDRWDPRSAVAARGRARVPADYDDEIEDEAPDEPQVVPMPQAVNPEPMPAPVSASTALVASWSQAPISFVGKRTGEILLATGKIEEDAVQRILDFQGTKGLRFGESAVAMGLIGREDLLQALARQFDYPYLVPGTSPISPELVAGYDPFGVQAEAMRALRSELAARWFDAANGGKALAIVSPVRGDGRSYMAANLAVVMSQLRRRTLLIDADMRNPRQHLIFGLDNTSGLSAVLSGRGEQRSVQPVAPFERLSVLAAGSMPPNPQELLGRGDFRLLLTELEREFDAIVIDTPPAGLYADAQSAAIAARGALVVARHNRTRTTEMSALVARLGGANVKVVGSILNKT